MPEFDPSPLAALQERLGYTFSNGALLAQALTHPSFLQGRADGVESNQRLEFLGDAVLQLVLTEALFERFPVEREGGLSKRRAALSKGAFLAGLARETGLEACLLLGASEEAAGGRDKASALEDAFEALLGAIYLDGGLPVASKVVRDIYGDLTARLAGVEDGENPKGRLQERIQAVHGNHALRYEVVAVEGADHARAFEVVVLLLDQPVGQGRGPSKKLAEEAAAQAALTALEEKKDGA